MSAREPERLRRGKQFQEQIQRSMSRDGSDPEVKVERQVEKPSGRRGRIDILIDMENEVAVIEIKASNWDRMTDRAVRRNVRRQMRQIVTYIETQMPVLEEGRGISMGVIFPHRPTSLERTQLIEEMFFEEGIQVSWEDETIEERRARAGDGEGAEPA